MAPPPRLTPERWAEVKLAWEKDERAGFEWLVRELELPVSPQAVRKRATTKGQEWVKASGAAVRVRAPKRAENAPKAAPAAPRKSTRDQKGRGSAVGEPEGGEQSPPKGFRKGIVPKRKKPASKGIVIDMATGEMDEPNGSDGSAGDGSDGYDDDGSDGYARQKWTPTIGSDEYLWRDQTPMVPPKDPEGKRGRPTVYQNIFAHQAFTFCLHGATNDDLATMFQVSTRTINRWLIDHKEFCHAVMAGRTKADSEVSKAIYKSAVGFWVPEVHVSNYKGKITLTEVQKYYPPNLGAAIFWNTNRAPDKWSSNPQLPPADPSSNAPFAEELDQQYQLSMQASAARAAKAREDRRRNGLFGKRPDLDNPEGDLLLEGSEDIE